MTTITITIDRAVVEQALEAFYEETAWFGPTPKGAAAITALRAALEQEQAEPEGESNLPPPLQEPTVAENATTQQQLEDTPPSDYRRGYWDGFAIGKREGRIEAEDAAKQSEPVQEPVYKVKVGGVFQDPEPLAAAFRLFDGEHLLYTAPPQRKPLTEEEILRIRDERLPSQGEPFDVVVFARAAIAAAEGETK